MSEPTYNPRVLELANEHQALQHAMQTGVMLDQERGSQCGTSKHLRVGLNTALVDHGSLVDLLVKKGIITDEEYAQAMRDGMQSEVDRYEARLGVKLA